MKFLLSLALLLVLQLSLSAQAPPRIFFSDLESGPNIGGQKNLGVWVTIWGKGFGAERGASTVTIGGGAAADYPIWTDNKITFQLGPAAKTGDIVVRVRAAGDRTRSESAPRSGIGVSNGLPFTVRAGKIYFVAVNGSDWRNGSFQSPWKTIVHAKDRMSAGDVTYIKDGVAQTSEDHLPRT